MLAPDDPSDGLDELTPAVALPDEKPAALRGQAVEAPAPLPRLLDPAPLHEATPLQPVQQRIERRRVEAHAALGALLDQPADLVAVPQPLPDDRQDEELGAALLPFPLDRSRPH